MSVPGPCVIPARLHLCQVRFAASTMWLAQVPHVPSSGRTGQRVAGWMPASSAALLRAVRLAPAERFCHSPG